jgi:hypothetical protein
MDLGEARCPFMHSFHRLLIFGTTGAHLTLDHLRRDLRLALRSLWRKPLIRPAKQILMSGSILTIGGRTEENRGPLTIVKIGGSILPSPVRQSYFCCRSPRFRAICDFKVTSLSRQAYTCGLRYT